MKDPGVPQEGSAGGATRGKQALCGTTLCIVMDGMTTWMKQSTRLLAPILRHMPEMLFLMNPTYVRLSDLCEFADVHFSSYLLFLDPVLS